MELNIAPGVARACVHAVSEGPQIRRAADRVADVLDEELSAVRETWEEATARVEILAPFSMFNLPHVNPLNICFRARRTDVDFKPGSESEDVRLLTALEIPWDDLAFGTVRHTLQLIFKDRTTGRFPMRAGTFAPIAEGFRFEAGPHGQLNAP